MRWGLGSLVGAGAADKVLTCRSERQCPACPRGESGSIVGLDDEQIGRCVLSEAAVAATQPISWRIKEWKLSRSDVRFSPGGSPVPPAH
jgi:hypothetical protein